MSLKKIDACTCVFNDRTNSFFHLLEGKGEKVKGLGKALFDDQSCRADGHEIRL